jgi:multidrug efflux pump subunit AcrA (membrane-fusion protein)
LTRRLIAVLVGAVVGIAACIVLLLSHRFAFQETQTNTAPNNAPNVRPVTARIGAFLERITVQGKIGPAQGSGAKLAFAQAGILRTVYVSVGQTVDAGQPLAELDRATSALTVTQAQYDSLSARIAQQSAQRQAEIKIAADQSAELRDERLLRGGIIAAKELETARTQIAADQETLRAVLEQAKATNASAAAKTQAARTAYSNGVILSPSRGIVFAVFKHPGEATDPGTPVIEIGPANVHEITLSVPADTAQRIHVGDPAQLPGHEGTAPARVAAVIPADDPTTQTAVVVLSGAPPNAVAGDAITAVIVVARITGVLVPSSSIVQDPQTGKTMVFVRDTYAKPGSPAYKLREVRVRASDASNAVLASGLRSGEQVATRGSYDLLAPIDQ